MGVWGKEVWVFGGRGVSVCGGCLKGVCSTCLKSVCGGCLGGGRGCLQLWFFLLFKVGVMFAIFMVGRCWCLKFQHNFIFFINIIGT